MDEWIKRSSRGRSMAIASEDREIAEVREYGVVLKGSLTKRFPVGSRVIVGVRKDKSQNILLLAPATDTDGLRVTQYNSSANGLVTTYRLKDMLGTYLLDHIEEEGVIALRIMK